MGDKEAGSKRDAQAHRFGCGVFGRLGEGREEGALPSRRAAVGVLVILVPFEDEDLKRVVIAKQAAFVVDHLRGEGGGGALSRGMVRPAISKGRGAGRAGAGGGGLCTRVDPARAQRTPTW